MDHIQVNLLPVPAPSRDTPFTLAEIIGQQGSQQIQATGSILFHTAGDTGRGADTPQGAVAAAMQTDFDIAHPAICPAFFFHLGDVCYGPNKDQGYRAEFYEPYVHYPGKIVAIPGNHDGEVFAGTDPVTLRAFMANFCAPAQVVPTIAGTIYRQTMNQPGVYYLLDAPFVQIVAMYSNAAENPGFISGTIPGPAQKAWLLKTLQAIAAARKAGTRKALIFRHAPSALRLGRSLTQHPHARRHRQRLPAGRHHARYVPLRPRAQLPALSQDDHRSGAARRPSRASSSAPEASVPSSSPPRQARSPATTPM